MHELNVERRFQAGRIKAQKETCTTTQGNTDIQAHGTHTSEVDVPAQYSRVLMSRLFAV